jgi:type VI secretion system secreted protein VgrG
MGEYKQDSRFIQVYTPLDPDVLLLAGFHGQEGVSRLFNFELRMHSEKGDLTFNKIVGKSTTIKMLLPNKCVRYINGIVSSFTQGGSWILKDGRHHQNLANYNATLVPWLWLLTRTGDCRIFQGKSVPEIISEVFKEHGCSNFKFLLEPGHYAKREYCVQYRETDFNFVSRLMEEEGIFYYFEHYENKHVMILADNYDHFKQSSLLPSISYSSNECQEEDGEIRDWSVTQEVRPGKYTVTDFNFIWPELDLTRTYNGADERKLEVYDYPGEFTEDKQGVRLARLRMEEEQSSMTVTNGASSCRGLAAGYWFNLYNHYQSDFNQTYVVLSVYHSAEQGANYRSTSESAAADFIYSNKFQCIRYKTQYRPPRVTPVPIVHGSQTAIVVGPDDEEIYVDQYGRVKVQFHWDRAGKYKVENGKPDTFCWVRVSQNWAGKRWGAIFLPRVGQEVIVDFLEGDPDKPIITGRVYNGRSMPPYDLPEHKTISGIKSHSSEGGGGFNEIRFQDLKGREQLFFHAERNHDIRIKRDRIEWVGNESHLIVKKDQLESVEGDKHLQVKGDRNEKVDGTVSLQSGKDIFRKTDARYALYARDEIHIQSGTDVVIESECALSLKVGKNFIKIDQCGIFISGTNVWINSEDINIKADSGKSSSPNAPRAPRAADHADPGASSQLPPPKTEVKPEAYKPGEVILKQAPQIGSPDTPPAQGSQEEELRSKQQELEMQQQELQRQREEFSRTAPLLTEQEQIIEPAGTVTATFDQGANGISNDGLQFIARWESFVPTPYNDAGNHAAIGYGHLLHRGPVTEADRRQFPNGMTRERGLELLRADAAIAENAVRDNVNVLLNQNQFDALTSFAYNVGAEAFANSTLLRELNAGNYGAVPGQINRWVNSEGRRVQGLVNRRAAEGELFNRVP